jgi:hypothetical protein
MEVGWRNDRAALFVLAVLALPFKSKLRLEPENAALRYQLIVLRRKVASGSRTKIAGSLIQPHRWFPSILKVLTIIRSETLVRWHWSAFAATGVGSRGQQRYPGKCKSLRRTSWVLPSFVANYNGRFAKLPARDKDLHRLLDPRQDLDEVLCWREQRQVSHQLVVNYSRMKLTLKPEGPGSSPLWQNDRYL